MASRKAKWIGASVKRKEDSRFLTGRGTYIDDIALPGMLYASILRSPYAHAAIKSIDVSRAVANPSVVDVLTGKEVKELTDPLGENEWLGEPARRIEDYILAVDKVRFVGEPVAVVVATGRAEAKDAAELIEVDYDPLPPVMDPEEAMKPDAALIHEKIGTNLAWSRLFEFGDTDKAFAEADEIVKERLHWHRSSPSPLEPSGVVANYDKATGTLTLWSNNQRPIFCLPYVSRALRLPRDKIRSICTDIGGGFGVKTNTYSYIALAALLSVRTGKPVKWIEERSEHLLTYTHCNEVVSYGELAVKKDGTILGLRAKIFGNEGAFMRREPLGILNMITRHGTSIYNFKSFRADVYCAITNKSPISPVRSYGKMQQCWMIDRLIDLAARKIGVDPAEMRLKNLVKPQQMPYTTPTGAVLDGGDYSALLKRAMELAKYGEFRAKQEALRKEGRYIGIGVGVGVDANPVNVSIYNLVDPEAGYSGDSEAAYLEITEDGRVKVATGSVSQGQGHETVIAQVVADELALTPDDVNVLPRFDSLTHPSSRYSGTYASRFTVMGFGAVKGALAKVKEKMLQITSHRLEAGVQDLEIRDGGVYIKGTDRGMKLSEIAKIAWRDLTKLPEGMEPGLVAHNIYKPEFRPPAKDGTGNFSLTYCPAIHVAVVEVDRETGQVKVLSYAALDDPGTVINPMIVEGQIHGAFVHQFAAALYEDMVYDQDGQLLTSNFMDYLVPSAVEIPSSSLMHFELMSTPSLFSVYGARGVGEGGGSPVMAVTAAVEDALAPFGAKVTESHVPPEYVYRLAKGQ